MKEIRYVDLQIGEGARLTLENGKEFKIIGNDKTKKWVVKLTETPTLTKVEIVNGRTIHTNWVMLLLQNCKVR